MGKRVLGKGLSAIISSTTPVDDLENGFIEERSRMVEISVDLIKPNPDQPRMHFDEEEIRELSESIKSAGLLQPIIVRQSGEEYFVIAGERRLRAVKLLGMRKIKSTIIRASEEENITLALIENIQRTNLDAIEEAKAYRLLISRFKLKQNELSQKIGKERATIANSLRLLNLPEAIQSGISSGTISVGHAKILLSVPESKQMEMYNQIVNRGLSVRAMEDIAGEEKKSGGAHPKKTHRDAHVRKMEEMLTSRLGTKVEIKHSGKKGKIEISYYSLDDFDRIIDLIK
jgi:ParB family transcriptional regulator, chromosome partitioning protein